MKYLILTILILGCLSAYGCQPIRALSRGVGMVIGDIVHGYQATIRR